MNFSFHVEQIRIEYQINLKMRIGYYREKTKNLHAASNFIDNEGNLYLTFISSLDRIHKFDKKLNKIDEIKISSSSDKLKNEIGLTSFDGTIMTNRGIFITSNKYIVLGNLRIFVVNMEGTLVQKVPIIKEPEKSLDKISLAPILQLDNGKVIQHAYTGRGSILAISDSKLPAYNLNSPIKSKYLNHTNFYDDLNNVNNMEIKTSKEFKSIAENLKKRKTYSDNKIFDVFQTSMDTILIRIMCTKRGRSYLPPKDTPYFLYLLNIKNGEIIKEVSPDDSSIYNENFYGKIFNHNRKT